MVKMSHSLDFNGLNVLNLHWIIVNVYKWNLFHIILKKITLSPVFGTDDLLELNKENYCGSYK